MKKVKLKKGAENNESICEFLGSKRKLKIGAKIMKDAMIFSRLRIKMGDVLNVSNPETLVHKFNQFNKTDKWAA